MKKKVAVLILFLLMTGAFVGIVEAAMHNPDVNKACVDKDGKALITKDCDPTVCSCLFHQVEEFLTGFFK